MALNEADSGLPAGLGPGLGARSPCSLWHWVQAGMGWVPLVSHSCLVSANKQPSVRDGPRGEPICARPWGSWEQLEPPISKQLDRKALISLEHLQSSAQLEGPLRPQLDGSSPAHLEGLPGASGWCGAGAGGTQSHKALGSLYGLI